MSSSSSSRNKAIAAGIAGAVGAGALIGLGFLVYQQFEKKKNDSNQREVLARRSNSSRNSKSEKGRRDSLCSTATEASSYYTCLDSDDSDAYEDCFSDVSLVGKANWEEQLFSEVDDLMKGGDQERSEAFKKLNEVKHEMRNNVEFLWRFAKAHQIEATVWEAKKNLEKKRATIFEGLKYAKKALDLDESNADAHKWFAVLTGMYVDFLSIKEKIESGYVFQEHVQKAIQLKPEDYSLYYLLGRFKFEVANTSWLEKKMAASLFGQLPVVTIDDAIEDLLKAEKLNSVPWKECRVLLARCYLTIKDYPSAKRWLESARAIRPKTEEDSAADRLIDDITIKYRNYL